MFDFNESFKAYLICKFTKDKGFSRTFKLIQIALTQGLYEGCLR